MAWVKKHQQKKSQFLHSHLNCGRQYKFLFWFREWSHGGRNHTKEGHLEHPRNGVFFTERGLCRHISLTFVCSDRSSLQLDVSLPVQPHTKIIMSLCTHVPRCPVCFERPHFVIVLGPADDIAMHSSISGRRGRNEKNWVNNDHFKGRVFLLVPPKNYSCPIEKY